MASPDELSEYQRLAVQGLALGIRQLRGRLESERRGFRATFTDDIVGARRRLVHMLAERGSRLTEDSWDWLRGEDDPEVLEFLTLLAAMPDRELGFSRLRRAMLENQALCHSTVAAMGHAKLRTWKG